MAGEDHVAGVDPDRRGAGRIGLVDRQQRVGGERRQHLGVRGGHEAVVGGDRDEFSAVGIGDDEAEPRAGYRGKGVAHLVLP